MRYILLTVLAVAGCTPFHYDCVPTASVKELAHGTLECTCKTHASTCGYLTATVNTNGSCLCETP